MSNLFTEQIADRALADEAMRRSAEELIDDAIRKNPSGDALSGLHSNAAALKKILSLCGIMEEKLQNIENEDILFTPVEGDAAWHRHQTGYCIGRDAEGRFIALLPGAFSGYYYLDEEGKKHRVNGKNTARFQKIWCLCRLLPEKTLNIQGLLRYLLSFLRRKALAVYILIALAAGVLGLVFPQMVSALMNSTDPSADGRGRILLGMAAFCVIAELVRLLLNTLLAAFESDFSNAVLFNIKNAAMIRYLSNTGERAARQGASEVWTAISESLMDFIRDLLSYGMSLIPHLIFTVCYCLMAAFYLRSLSLWMFLVLALLAASMWSMEVLSDRWCTQSLNNRIRGDHIIFQIFKGIEKIRSRQAQNRVYLKWAEIYSQEAFCDKQRKKYIAASTGIQDFVTPLLTVVLIGAVVFTPITRSNLMTGTLLAGLLAGQIVELIQIAERIVNSKSLWQTISFLFEAPVREKKVKCSDFTAGVSVHRLSFAYPGMERLLDDVSFDVKPGEYIGIVGMSGCGKSTLLKLLLGILTPDKGEISYGRYVLSDTDQRSIIRNMGIVLQNESLIPGTIRQNMMMQPRPVTEEKIWKTLETVKIADLVRSYPYGLDTEIGMSGASMSGGQMQKLLIARAIISDPKMIVFDEATSALDNVSQKEIKDALDSMKCTRIVVAHRLSTVKDCDRIILLDKGKISQQGTYEELVNHEGLFRELVLCQGA